MALKDNNKTLIIDVMDAYVYKGNDLIFYSENLTSTNLKNEVKQSDVNNGKGNSLFSVLNQSKSASITLSSNVFSFATVALNTGLDIVTGTGVAYKNPEIMTLDATKKITLVSAPLIEGELAFLKLDGTPIVGVYESTGKTVTFATGVTGDKVKVMPYKYESPATSTTITVDSDTFATGVRLVLKTYEKGAGQTILSDIDIICENCIPLGSWELNTKSEVQAEDSKIELKVMIDSEGNYYKIVKTPRV